MNETAARNIRFIIREANDSGIAAPRASEYSPEVFGNALADHVRARVFLYEQRTDEISDSHRAVGILDDTDDTLYEIACAALGRNAVAARFARDAIAVSLVDFVDDFGPELDEHEALVVGLARADARRVDEDRVRVEAERV